MTDLETLSQAILAAAKKAGADTADAIVVSGDSLSIEVANAALEHAERAEGIDLGLRVMIGQRQACVSVSDSRSETIETMAERAVAMAREAPEDPHIGLADPADLAQNWDVDALQLADPSAAPDPDALKQFALEAEAAALAVNGVDKVDSAGAGYSKTSIHLATSNGFSGGYSRTSTSISAVAITGTGLEMERDYNGEGRTFASDMPSAADIGRIAGERTIARKGAKKPPTGTFPVLYDERISSGLIGHLVSAINGSMIARGSSWLKDALGEMVLPQGMDLVEDPSRIRVAGSKPFDAEGLLTQRRALVENGILQGWTLDLATARKLNMQSTASAARGTSAPPSPSVGNLNLSAGNKTRAELISDMGTGLIITSLIGSSINGNTGDYSRGASGFWVENGEITGPVNECTVAGNLRDMLGSIIAANDGRSHLSRVVPSLLVESMTIAGA
ncbi:MAG: TldD/PmbA family protein [Rhodobacteraceae bacterium]|nr:TldD/PmbA family protein [Paracoccaceae bacterium]